MAIILLSFLIVFTNLSYAQFLPYGQNFSPHQHFLQQQYGEGK